jgi:hypothetical protein
MKLYQEYQCEKCGLKSKIEFKEDSKVYEVVMAVDNDHQKKSPKCEIGISNLKLNGIRHETVQKVPCFISEGVNL